MNALQTTTSDINIQDCAHQLAQQVAGPLQEGIGLDMGAPIKPGFWDRQLLANAKRSGIVAAAKTWAEGQARMADLVVKARIEVARQGLQALVASLGAQAHAKAARIINEADREFQNEIASQIVDFTTRYNAMIAHAVSQTDPKLRTGLEGFQEQSLLKFLASISEREDQFRQVTKKRIEEVLK